MLWDTAGQEEFDAITKAYYRGENTMFIIWWLGGFGLHIFKIFFYLLRILIISCVCKACIAHFFSVLECFPLHVRSLS